MIFKKCLPVLLAFYLTAPAVAQQRETPEDTCDVVLLSETSVPLDCGEAEMLPAAPTAGNKAVIVPAVILVAGVKAWNIIVNGRPASDISSAYASAIPGFKFNWNALNDWKKVTRKYRLTMGNKIQGNGVDIIYEVSFFHGAIATPGTNGLRGHYIANFTVKPEKIDLKWGWHISMDVSMSDPMNVGTPQEPVAMLQADLKWQYIRPFDEKPRISLNSVSINGLGQVDEQSYGALDITLQPPAPAAGDIPAIRWD